MSATPLAGDDPRSIHEWRLMPYMLPMAASQIGYPVALFVEMKPNNGLIHDTQRTGFKGMTEAYRFSNDSSGR
jgi:hypothetical protein